MHLELLEGDGAPDPITDLFARARHDDYTFTSRPLEFTIEPLQLGYRGIDNGHIHFHCDTTHDWYHDSRDKYKRRFQSRIATVKSTGSWRQIKLGWKNLPIKVSSRYERFFDLKLTPMATLGDLVDGYSMDMRVVRELNRAYWQAYREAPLTM